MPFVGSFLPNSSKDNFALENPALDPATLSILEGQNFRWDEGIDFQVGYSKEKLS